MSTKMQPLGAELLNMPSGQVAFQPEGGTTLVPLGFATASGGAGSTKTEIRTPEDPNNPVVATDYGEGSASFDIEFGSLNRLGLGLAFLADVKPYVQDVVAQKTQKFSGARVLEWLELKGGAGADAAAQAAAEAVHPGLINVVVTKVTIGGQDLAVTDYRIDAEAGVVQVTKWPAGAAAQDVSVTFSAPAVAAAADVDCIAILQKLVFRGRLVIRQNNKRGRPRKFVLPKVAFGGDKTSVQIIADASNKDVVKVKVTATIEADYSQPAGMENGYIVGLAA